MPAPASGNLLAELRAVAAKARQEAAEAAAFYTQIVTEAASMAQAAELVKEIAGYGQETATYEVAVKQLEEAIKSATADPRFERGKAMRDKVAASQAEKTMQEKMSAMNTAAAARATEKLAETTGALRKRWHHLLYGDWTVQSKKGQIPFMSNLMWSAGSHLAAFNKAEDADISYRDGLLPAIEDVLPDFLARYGIEAAEDKTDTVVSYPIYAIDGGKIKETETGTVSGPSGLTYSEVLNDVLQAAGKIQTKFAQAKKEKAEDLQTRMCELAGYAKSTATPYPAAYTTSGGLRKVAERRAVVTEGGDTIGDAKGADKLLALQAKMFESAEEGKDNPEAKQ
jgi:hypothetical protein